MPTTADPFSAASSIYEERACAVLLWEGGSVQLPGCPSPTSHLSDRTSTAMSSKRHLQYPLRKTIFGPRKKYFLLLHEPDAVVLVTVNPGVTGYAGLYDMADPICWQRFTCTPRVSWGQSVFVTL